MKSFFVKLPTTYQGSKNYLNVMEAIILLLTINLIIFPIRARADDIGRLTLRNLKGIFVIISDLSPEPRRMDLQRNN